MQSNLPALRPTQMVEAIYDKELLTFWKMMRWLSTSDFDKQSTIKNKKLIKKFLQHGNWFRMVRDCYEWHFVTIDTRPCFRQRHRDCIQQRIILQTKQKSKSSARAYLKEKYPSFASYFHPSVLYPCIAIACCMQKHFVWLYMQNLLTNLYLAMSTHIPYNVSQLT